MLLEYDGLDSVWNDPENWAFDTDDDGDIMIGVQMARARARARTGRANTDNDDTIDVSDRAGDFSFVRSAGLTSAAEDAGEVEQSCWELQQQLVEHFWQVRSQVGWCRRRVSCA
jgi:hypothetical protein